MHSTTDEVADTISTIQPGLVDDGTPTTQAPSPVQILEPIDTDSQEKTRTKLRLSAILLSLYLVLFIAALDQTIVATAIPTITASLHSASGYVWIGSAYLLANAAAGPLWAKCSDIWGRKPALLAAICLFAVASIIAALSVNMSMLIAARALQGTAGGALMSLVTITICDLFSVRERSLYIGLLGLMWAVAGTAGPLIGGSLTQLVSWRWCFWINLPVCGLAFVLLTLLLDVHNPRTPLRDGVAAIDWYGTFSMLAVTLLLLLGLDFGGAIFPWSSPKVICLLAFGTAMIAIFIFSEKRLATYPLMPLRMFHDRSNNAIAIISFAHSMVSIGIEFYLPLYFQSVKQASPLRSGILILPMMLTEASVDILVGILISRTGRYREIIWTGVIFMTLGTSLYTLFDTDTTLGIVIGLQIIGGIGPAFLFQAPMIAVQNTVSQSDTATATSTLGLIRNIATALSIVLGGVVFQNSIAAHQSTLANTHLNTTVLNSLSAHNAAANVAVIGSIPDPAQRHIVRDVFATSLRNIFIMYACVSAIALVASIFIRHRDLKTEHTETKTGIENMTRKRDDRK